MAIIDEVQGLLVDDDTDGEPEEPFLSQSSKSSLCTL